MKTTPKLTPIYDVIRAAGFKPIERIYSSESASKCAARMMDGRTFYYTAETLRYFNASVSRLAEFDGVALVCLERASAHSDGTGKGYRVTVHDLDGHCFDSREYGAAATWGIKRRDVDDLIASKTAADREFSQVCDIVAQHTREMLAQAIERATRRHARALEDLKNARRLVNKRLPAPPPEYIVQANYGQGWEDVNTETTRKDGARSLREYRENMGGALRLITRRGKVGA